MSAIDAEQALIAKHRRQAAYAQYLESPHWQQTKARILTRDGHRCVRCKRADGLCVHHKSYARVGHELDGDLETLCKKCHRRTHVKDGRILAKWNYMALGTRRCPNRHCGASCPAHAEHCRKCGTVFTGTSTVGRTRGVFASEFKAIRAARYSWWIPQDQQRIERRFGRRIAAAFIQSERAKARLKRSLAAGCQKG